MAHPSHSDIGNPFLISYLTLRKTLGFIAILLPLTLVVGSIIIGKCNRIQYSVSHYYYTVMGDVFVGAICAISLFLITYRGYNEPKWYFRDRIFTTLAGVVVLGVAFFPTSQDDDCHCSIKSLPNLDIRVITHYCSASIFFITLAYISFFLFTKSKHKKEDRTPEKRVRNKIYRICGGTIIASILLILFLGKSKNHEVISFVNDNHIIFWLEWLALASFGFSWLTKGEFILKDY